MKQITISIPRLKAILDVAYYKGKNNLAEYLFRTWRNELIEELK